MTADMTAYFCKLNRLCYCFKIKQKLDDIIERLPEEFNLRELFHKVEEKTPYTIVALQECERMNILTNEIRSSLKELNLGLKVWKMEFTHF